MASILNILKKRVKQQCIKESKKITIFNSLILTAFSIDAKTKKKNSMKYSKHAPHDRENHMRIIRKLIIILTS